MSNVNAPVTPELLAKARAGLDPLTNGDRSLCIRCATWFKPSFGLTAAFTCQECERNPMSAEEATAMLAKVGLRFDLPSAADKR